ncbi:MAG: hypothetical protein EBQ96_06370 [Proteobacteria bacterium]|nr:hypothetical protein [Pseudomonadota bacterium]
MPKSKIQVVGLPTHKHLTDIAGDGLSPDQVLDAQLMVGASKDGLTEEEIRYMRKRVRKLAKNLRKQYELLGRASGETRQVDCTINLVERSVKIEFSRVSMNKWITEATIEADIGFIRPRTQKELKELGIVAKRDPDEPERVVTLSGRIYRPFGRPEDNWHELPLDSFRISKIPTSGIQLFNRMVEDGFLYHPRVCNYLPFRDGDTPLEPLGRRDRRSQEKLPLQVLETEQRKFVRDQFNKFIKNLRTRYDHVFEHVSVDVDAMDRTFVLSFNVSDSFAGEGSPKFNIQGEFDLTWRNKGKAGTALELRVTGGLSKQFQESVKLTAPINIANYRVEEYKDGKKREKRNGKRAMASDLLFNILAMSGKVGVSDYMAAREAQKVARIFKPTRADRRVSHSRERGKARKEIHLQLRQGGNG